MAQCACGLFQQATLVSRLRTQSGTRRPALLTHGSSLLPTAHGLNKSPKHRRHQALAVLAAATAEVGKLIASTEIPAFIPRQDLMDQLTRWAYTDIQEEGMRKFGLPCKIQPIRREGIPWGFTTSIIRDGVTLTDISVSFDEEVVYKYDWVGKAADGFPQLEGNAEEIMGKNFVIRKADDNTIDEQTRSVIRIICQEIQASINKYYAFGSCFVDDAT
ncbi:hypothetical protein ABBQ38_004169 [Trebouxia sp. C0009 RCD-2024]